MLKHVDSTYEVNKPNKSTPNNFHITVSVVRPASQPANNQTESKNIQTQERKYLAACKFITLVDR